MRSRSPWGLPATAANALRGASHASPRSPQRRSFCQPLNEGNVDYGNLDYRNLQATRLTDADNQATFKEQIARQLDMGVTFAGLSGWEHLVNAIRERASATPGLTLVLGEFPYLCESNPGLPSVLQTIRDEVAHEGIPFNLILCGSRIARAARCATSLGRQSGWKRRASRLVKPGVTATGIPLTSEDLGRNFEARPTPDTRRCSARMERHYDH